LSHGVLICVINCNPEDAARNVESAVFTERLDQRPAGTLCPSVRLSRRSTTAAKCGCYKRGRLQQISIDSCRRSSSKMRVAMLADGISCPPPAGKMGEKLKSENMQKRAVFYVYVIV